MVRGARASARLRGRSEHQVMGLFSLVEASSMIENVFLRKEAAIVQIQISALSPIVHHAPELIPVIVVSTLHGAPRAVVVHIPDVARALAVSEPPVVCNVHLSLVRPSLAVHRRL